MIARAAGTPTRLVRSNAFLDGATQERAAFVPARAIGFRRVMHSVHPATLLLRISRTLAALKQRT